MKLFLASALPLVMPFIMYLEGGLMGLGMYFMYMFALAVTFLPAYMIYRRLK